jgi:hypothetical protein
MRLFELLHEGAKVKPIFEIEFTMDGFISSSTDRGRRVIDAIKKLQFFLEYDCEGEILTIDFDLPRQMYGGRLDQFVDRTKKILVDILRQDFNSIWDTRSCIICDGGIPEWKIIYPGIKILCTIDTTFSGIDKLITSCDELQIMHCQLIEPSGVLSLLRLNKMTYVGLNVDGTVPPKWVEIVQEHLDRDRDIMDCHEALTRAGLKEYAKL